MRGNGDLWDHLRALDLARSLLANLRAMVELCEGAEPACKAMAAFGADMMQETDAEAAGILREYGAPKQSEPGPLTVRLAEARRARR